MSWRLSNLNWYGFGLLLGICVSRVSTEFLTGSNSVQRIGESRSEYVSKNRG
jgi:hypothetical protein